MSDPKPKTVAPTPRPSPAPGSAIRLPDPGYYWMHNLAGENDDESIWRIVRVVRRLKVMMVRDGAQLYSVADLSGWKGISFHGPLHPPNSRKE